VSRSGGQALVRQIELLGADAIFCVPGESYLPVLDALHDSPIRLISCRHEASAANMAEAFGKLTGRPGICLVTRGPGATHASVGVHTAWQDSTPLILLVGQVPRASRGRDAFQELDYTAVFGSTTKWTVEVDQASAVPEAVARAFAAALSARPGPVVLALPEDVLAEETDAADAAPVNTATQHPAQDELERLRQLLSGASRPLAIVGEGGWSAETARDVLAFAEANELPVAASFRCQDYVDNGSRVYVGPLTVAPDPALARRVESADLILAIGGRLGDVTTRGYILLAVPRPSQTIVHVHPDPDEPGRVYETDLAIASGLPEFAAAAVALEPVDPSAWRAWAAEARAEYLANLQHTPWPTGVDLGEVMAFLRRRLPEDAVFTSGAGNFTVWAHRFYEFSRYGTQLAPRSGAMGYGVPAALAAKVAHPDRMAVCLAGDGDFLMAGQELATAVQYELPAIFLVANNGMLGTIRMHQERLFPGRPVGTDLVNPDFAAYARSFGAFGAAVERTEQLEAVFEEAVESGLPAVLELDVDPEAITPRATLTQIREGAR
jgi:acetolactate synthase-1/2/3 large subunit